MNLIERQQDLDAVVEAVADSKLVGADTEAAGYHRYHDRICLLQLSTRSQTFLLDTLALERLGGLGALLDALTPEVIFHDADYDLRLLHRDFGARVHGLFDTKIAAQFLGASALGLASLLESHLGITIEKKYQRADWARRPLPPDMISYAAEDTRYLPDLRDALRDALESHGRLHWAEEEFRITEAVQWEDNGDDGNAFLRLKGTRDLDPRGLAALRELYQWREEVARERDVATFRVLSNAALIAAAASMPGDEAALARVSGMGRSIIQRWGDALLAAVERARRLPEDALPRRPKRSPRPPYDPELDARVERLKAERDRAADALALDRGFLMPRWQLERIARALPETREDLAALPSVRRWQMDAIGDRILAALHER